MFYQSLLSKHEIYFTPSTPLPSPNDTTSLMSSSQRITVNISLHLFSTYRIILHETGWWKQIMLFVKITRYIFEPIKIYWNLLPIENRLITFAFYILQLLFFDAGTYVAVPALGVFRNKKKVHQHVGGEVAGRTFQPVNSVQWYWYCPTPPTNRTKWFTALNYGTQK